MRKGLNKNTTQFTLTMLRNNGHGHRHFRGTNNIIDCCNFPGFNSFFHVVDFDANMLSQVHTFFQIILVS